MQDAGRSAEWEGRRAPARLPAFLRGGGLAGELIGELGPDGPLGPPARWPETLRRTLEIVLPSRAQIAVFWGRDYIALYNDAYAPTIGDKHPLALGRPARENWGEMWDALLPLLDGVRRTGEPLEGRDHRFLIRRHGYMEEVFFDISYSPLREGASVAGVMCVVSETTGRVLAHRRLGALRALASGLAASPSPEAALSDALQILSTESPHDLPWGRAVLRREDGTISHVASKGVMPAALEATIGGAVGAVLAGDLPREMPGAIVLPLMAGAAVAGAFVAGLNPHQRLGGDYGSYLGLAAGQVSLAVTRLLREAEERRAGDVLRESEARFRRVADHAPVQLWMTDPAGLCTYRNARWHAFTGQAPGTGLGLDWLEAVHPEDRAAAAAAVAEATAGVRGVRSEYRLRAAGGEYAWVIDAAEPRLDAEGRFAGLVGSVLDISDRRRAEEARDLLARELSHRIKNIFMVTGGLAALTARGDPAAETFAARLQARLRALSLAHDLVPPPDGAGAEEAVVEASLTVHGLVRALLDPYDDRTGRVSLAGEDRPLGYAAAHALALVLHEQATNAVKYGALSAPAGRLRIATSARDGLFRLDWEETGGPPVAGPPGRRGFGTALAGRSLAGPVRGSMTHDWRPEGLAVRIEVPEAALQGGG